MNFGKSILAGVSVIGLLGFAPAVSLAQDTHQFYDSRKSIEDDSLSAPNMPSVRAMTTRRICPKTISATWNRRSLTAGTIRGPLMA